MRQSDLGSFFLQRKSALPQIGSSVLEGKRESGSTGEGEVEGGDGQMILTSGTGNSKRRRVVAAPEPVPATAEVSTEVAGLTEYEKERAENIRRNNEILQSLGIVPLKVETRRGRRRSTDSADSAATRVKSKAPVLPVRRSARLRNIVQADVAESGAPRQTASVEDGLALHESETRYDDSSVVAYMSPTIAGRQAGATTPGFACNFAADGSVSKQNFGNFQPGGIRLQDAALTRIYTMDAITAGVGQPMLLAAAGHQGRIAVYGPNTTSGNAEELSPLLSWKGAAGWISHIQFLSRQDQVRKTQDGATLMLSSSNDRTVVLWDINKQEQGDSIPRIVAQTSELHSGGIFSMHEFGGLIGTSSKDSSVSIAVLADNAIRQLRSFSGFHHGPIKGIRFRDSNVLATCGSNGRICLLDLRLREVCTQTMETCHLTAVNTVEWNKCQTDLLLSASNDPHLLIHDVRSPATHLHKLSGHVHPSLSRCKRIYRPAFVHHGKRVVSPGEGSDHISLYSVDSGQLMSSLHIGYDPTMVMITTTDEGTELVWLAGKQVALFLPVMETTNTTEVT